MELGLRSAWVVRHDGAVLQAVVQAVAKAAVRVMITVMTAPIVTTIMAVETKGLVVTARIKSLVL